MFVHLKHIMYNYMFDSFYRHYLCNSHYLISSNPIIKSNVFSIDINDINNANI